MRRTYRDAYTRNVQVITTKKMGVVQFILFLVRVGLRNICDTDRGGTCHDGTSLCVQ